MELTDSLARDLDPRTGFLPRRAPARTLARRFAPWVEAAAELPSRYHAPHADVRAWLTQLFVAPVADAEEAVAALSEPELDRLLTVLGVLGHAFRWRSAPPAPDAYQIERLELPPGIASLWGALCRRQGHPRVGNLFSMVLANWELDGVEGGAEYEPEALAGEGLRVAIPWLAPSKEEALRAFLRTGIETEAYGAAVIRTAVDIVSACARENTHEATYWFERLHGELAQMALPFRKHVSKKLFSSDDFLTLIQPTTIWGLDEGEGALEGASGPQVGAIQVMDALLGISRQSEMGQAILHTRRYLPARHQRFLVCFEKTAPVVRRWVVSARDRSLTALFNACVSSMRAWRLVHQKRGAMYLKPETPAQVTSYASTGGVVALEDERIRRFEGSMQERVLETMDVSLAPPVDDPLPERPFRFLTVEDLEALRAAAWVHSYSEREVVLASNTRRTGLYIVRSGTVEARTEDGRVLSRLSDGEVFGARAYLENAPTSASFVALSDCRVEIIPREHIFALSETRDGFNTRFLLSLAQVFATRMHRTSARLAEAEAELDLLRGIRTQRPPPRRLSTRGGDRRSRDASAFELALVRRVTWLVERTGLGTERAAVEIDSVAARDVGGSLRLRLQRGEPMVVVGRDASSGRSILFAPRPTSGWLVDERDATGRTLVIFVAPSLEPMLVTALEAGVAGSVEWLELPRLTLKLARYDASSAPA